MENIWQRPAKNTQINRFSFKNTVFSVGRLLGSIAFLSVLSVGAIAATGNFTTSGAQTWTVPAGVTSLTVVATGAGGGGGWGAAGGKGGVVTSTLSVTPGQVLSLFVGGGGGGTASEGGGGGGSTNIDAGTANQIIAGGGGGGGGGAGGNGNGGNGGNGSGPAGTGGQGGSGGIGGAAGVNNGRTCAAAATGSNGSGGPGGVGGTDNASLAPGVAGLGSGSGAGGAAATGAGLACAPGGGGGGYGGGGGGGGAASDGGGGGGGSVGPSGSVYSLGTNQGASATTGGNGSVSITYTVSSPAAISPASQIINGTVGTVLSASTAFTASNFSGAVSYAISPSLPSGLSLNTSSGVISGTPTAAQTATTYTVTATGATSGTATATVILTVVQGSQSAMTLTASPSTVRVGRTSTLSVSGGSGTGAVSYAVTSGSCTVSGATLSTGSDVGTCVVTATKAADSTYSATTATATITVNASLAQAIDASVKGTINAQATAATRFAETQIRNISDHLSQLGSGLGIKGNRFAVGLDSPTLTKLNQLQPLLMATVKTDEFHNSPTMHSDSQMPQKAPGFLLAMDGARATAKTSANDVSEWDRERLDERLFAFWASGQVVHGNVGVETSTNKFHTDGVSLGIDFELSRKAIMGAALGYGSDNTEVDTLGTRVKGQQVTLTAYGVYEPVKGWLLDGLLGFGDLSFDNDRYSALSSTVFSAQRKGSSSYAALGLSSPLALNDFNIKPYVRASYIETVLNAYNEGTDTNALAFERSAIFSSALSLGVMASYDFVQADGGKWTPQAKLELRRNAAGSVNQVISFADTPGTTAALDMATAPRDIQLLGLGISYVHKNGVRFGLSLFDSQGSDSYRSTGYKLDASFPF